MQGKALPTSASGHLAIFECAPVAQLDRAFASGAKGRWFESTRAYHIYCIFNNLRYLRLPFASFHFGQTLNFTQVLENSKAVGQSCTGSISGTPPIQSNPFKCCYLGAGPIHAAVANAYRSYFAGVGVIRASE